MSDARLPPDLEKTFGALFEDFFSRRVAPKGDVRAELKLTHDEAAAGVRRTVTITRAQPCEPCAGRGSTNPAAARTPCATCNGTGQRQHTQGFFTVQTVCETCKGTRGVIADPCAACNGVGSRGVPASLDVVVPPGVHDGQTLRLPNAGHAGPDGERGAVFVSLRVVVPPNRQDLPAARVTRGVREPRHMIVDRIGIALFVLILMAALYWIMSGR